MPMITTRDGVEIFYKDWGRGGRSCSATAGRFSADDWDAQMLFFLATASGSSPTTGVATGARRRSATATTWTTTPTTWRR